MSLPDPLQVMLLAEMRRVNRRLLEVEKGVKVMIDWLTSSPLPAKVCPNCGGYYVGFRCESCPWTDPDDDEVDDPTDVAPTEPDELPEVSDPPGGEAGP